MSRQQQKHLYFMEVAKLTSTLSTCKSLQVGAVIVKDGHIIASGFNGVPSGLKHCVDVETEDHKHFADNYEIHAEMNAMFDALDRGQIVRGAVLYCTHSPCPNCYKHIVRAGIETIVYDKVYHRSSLADIDTMVNNFKSEKGQIACNPFKNYLAD